MQSFAIRPMTWPVLRLFSRNPLVRTSDRIETAAGTLAAVLVVITTAFAGVFGTIIHDHQSQKYLQQAQTRHAVVATAIDDSESVVAPETMAFTVHARWRFNGVNHTDLLGWKNAVKAGDSLHIWVDDRGTRAERPNPVERAAVDAVAAAVVGWLIVVAAAAQVVAAVRAHATRTRNAQWELDIRCLIDDEGGRTNRSQ
jgi:hypothetical protein